MIEYNIKNIYHGTSKRFKSFKHNVIKNVKAKDTDNVIYATDYENEARIAGSPDKNKSIVIKLEGRMNNPYIIDCKGTEKHKSFGKIGYTKLIKIAKSNKNDGIIIKNVIDFSDIPQTTYIFFNSEDVKISN
jgi:hypothetical protein